MSVVELDGTLGQLAAIGSRAAGYNHDIASKIQGVMMAIDEISELAKDPDIQRAAETAHAALGELNQLLQHNRALTKPPIKTRVDLGELVGKAAARVGVALRGTKPTGEVAVAVPLVTQGLSLAIDFAAGTERRRSIEVWCRADGQGVTIGLPIAPAVDLDPDAVLAIASWIIKRDGGELIRGDSALIVRLMV